MVNYKNGQVYKLVSNVDDKIYVGSTCNGLNKRKGDHKRGTKTKPDRYVYKHFNEIGVDNMQIILIEDCPCENKQQLLRRERYWIEELGSKLNNNIPGRKNHEYYQDHKNSHKKNTDNWRAANPEKNKIISKRSNDKRGADKFKCNCGSTLAKRDKVRHDKTAKHLKFLETGVVIDKYKCECGGRFADNSTAKTIHEKSNKHQAYLKTLEE